MPCLSDELAEGFVRGRLSPDERDEVESHLCDCADCCTLVAECAKWWQDDAWATTGVPAEAALASGPVETLPGDGAALPLAPGTRLGRHRIVRPLGAGSAGAVYEGHDPELDRRVAIKVLHARGVAATGARGGWSRIQREGRALARLSHPNLLAVHDAGVEGDCFYLVLELCDGPTAAEWLRARARPWREILALFIAAGKGLAAAHTADVVHGDFKPANVLIDHTGRPRVADFGLARVGAARRRQGLRPTGTPHFIAPEVRAGSEPDPKSDQFSFCVSLQDALASCKGVPSRVRKALSRGTSAAPEQRFPSMDALLRALGPVRPRSWPVTLSTSLLLVVAGVAFWNVRRPERAGTSQAARLGPPGCGDGLRVAPEECDDGNRKDGDACSAGCLSCAGPRDFLWSGNGHCYSWIETEADWSSANAACAERGGALVSFEHQAELSAVRTGLSHVLARPAWIGLRATPLRVGWVQGTGVDSSTGAVLDRESGPLGCAYQEARALAEPTSGLWRIEACERRLPALCERAPWLTRLASGHGYHLTASPTVTAPVAAEHCARVGAHLATIADADEQMFVSRLVSQYTWLGASDSEAQGRFVWNTGEPFAYRNFAPGQPNDDPNDERGRQDCLIMGADGQWHDGWCNGEHGYVCEVTP